MSTFNWVEDNPPKDGTKIFAEIDFYDIVYAVIHYDEDYQAWYDDWYDEVITEKDIIKFGKFKILRWAYLEDVIKAGE